MAIINEDAEDQILPDELMRGLTALVEQIDLRDQFARDRLMKVYKRNEYFWEGIQNIYFSEVAHDWRYAGLDTDEFANDPYEEANIEAKVVNIYKAHGEIIIAAISQSLPSTRFFPNDADQAADIYTAQAFSRLAELIRKHNKAPFLFMKAIGLFTIRESSQPTLTTTVMRNTVLIRLTTTKTKFNRPALTTAPTVEQS